MKNKNIIKTKKAELIIFNDGYLCINSNYLIKADYVQLDDTLLQHKILNKEPFAYNSVTNRFYDNIAPLKQLIPIYSDDFTPLKYTNLDTTILKTKANVFYNDIKQYFTYFNADYISVFNNALEHYNFVQTESLGQGVAFSKDFECLGLIMPMQNRYSFLNRFKEI